MAEELLQEEVQLGYNYWTKKVGDLPATALEAIASKIPTTWAVDKKVDEEGRHVLHVDLCTSLPYTEQDVMYAQLVTAWGLVDHVVFCTTVVGRGDEVRQASLDDFRRFAGACKGLPFSLDSSHKAHLLHIRQRQQQALLLQSKYPAKSSPLTRSSCSSAAWGAPAAQYHASLALDCDHDGW